MRASKRLKRHGEYWLVQAFIWLARGLPRSMGHRVFSAVGALVARILPRDRRRAVDNLGVAFPELGVPLRVAWTQAMFKSLGRNVYEALTLKNATRSQLAERVARVEGMECFEAAHAKGRGVIVITGHIGCWEIMPAYFVSIGYPVSVVGRRMRVERLNQQLVNLRRSFGVETFDRDSSPRAMLEPLRRGEILGVLIDQHTSVAGVYVPFFGKPAHTPTAVARIAMLTGAPIVPMAVFLDRDGRHVIHVLPAIEGNEEGGDRAESVRRITAECSLAVEKLIRIDPKQWVWFHHRWREPEAEDVLAESA